MNENKQNTLATDLSEESLSQLGLNDQPFRDHAGDNYLYSDSHLDMTSNIIMEYLLNPSTTVILTGERGVGKTTFLRKVLRLGYQRYQFCTVRVRKDTNFELIEEKIKQRWELSPASVQSPIIDLSIENYVISYLREHPHAVLIIDDAHHLDSSTLDRLLTLKHRIGLACPKGMGFIMAGEKPLKVKITELEESNPACTQVYQIDVRPLNKEQTASYIQHRLTTAGLESESPFNDEDIATIYELTSGNIRQIHLEAARLLQDQSHQKISHESSDTNSEVKKPNTQLAIVVGVIAVIIVLVLFAHFRSNQTNQTDTVIPLDTPPNKEPVDSIESTLPIDSIDNLNSGLENDPIAAIIEEYENSKTEGFPNKSTTEDDVKSLEKNNPLLAESIEHIEQPTEEINTAIEIESATDITPTHGQDWLKNLDASHFTLQVVASQNTKQLEHLIKTENLTHEYAYFSKPVNGTTYYVLVIGSFKNRQEAINSVEKLSNKLQKNKPWPVAISSIHPHLK